MNCPDTESLIAFALNPLAAENDEIAEHVHGCPECRMNLRLVNESLLADEWCSEESLKGDDEAESAYSEGQVAKYIKVLDRDRKDRHGKWLHEGDAVLVDPGDPMLIELATEEAKRRFFANGFGFYRALPKKTLADLKRVGSEINRFGPAVDRNMAVMVGKTIPALNLPAWVNLIPAPMRVAFRNFREIKADREALANWLAGRGHLPTLETLTDAARKALVDANFFRVYELRSGSICFRVFAIYITPVTVGKLTLAEADIDIYRSVKEFVKEWDRDNDRANCKCYILGSSGGWPNVPPIVLTDGVGVLCSPDPKRPGAWTVCHQDLDSFMPVFRSFVYGLYPETAEARVSRVRAVIEEVLTSYTKQVSAQTVSERTGLPVELVETAFDVLQDDPRSGFENCEIKGSAGTQNAIQRATADKSKRRLFQRPTVKAAPYVAKGVLLVLTAFGGELGRQYVASGAVKMGLYAICLTVIFITYAQSCFEGFCNRILEKGK